MARLQEEHGSLPVRVCQCGNQEIAHRAVEPDQTILPAPITTIRHARTHVFVGTSTGSVLLLAR
jgi:hypothetical protein